MISEIKNKLRSGDFTIGSWMQLPDTSVAEIMGKSGYDWVVVDLEHGQFSREKLPDIFRALELGGTLPIARLTEANPKDIKQALDAGAQGLIFPMIESSKQLEQAISASFYPPIGTRGVGYARANLFGKYFENYFKSADDLILIAQIEHIKAFKQLDDIFKVEYLDGILVGPYDLSASMGLTGQFEHPHYIEALDTLKKKTIEHQISMGLHIVEPEPLLLKQKIEEGYQFIAYSIDAVFLNHSAQSPID